MSTIFTTLIHCHCYSEWRISLEDRLRFGVGEGRGKEGKGGRGNERGDGGGEGRRSGPLGIGMLGTKASALSFDGVM